jgi:hypothetical protein
MSAAATALVKEQPRTLAMRLADPAASLAYLSLLFAALLVLFPVSFPHVIISNWQSARLTPVMIFFTVSVNLGLYLAVAHQRSARPGILAAACLGSVPVILLAALNFLLQATIAHTLAGNIPNAPALVDEEILAHTYFAMIAAIFAPFLIIRLAQQFHSTEA